MSLSNPRSYVPRRVVIGAKAHAVLADAIRRERPDLELRGNAHTDLTADDLAWADAYVGFRRPPHATMGNVRWVHSTGAGVDPWFFPDELPPQILITRSSESFGPMIAEWALARALAFTQQIPDLVRSQDRRQWAPRDVGTLRGTTAVVVGTGDVGRHVGRLFAAAGCIVQGVSRSGTGDPMIFSHVVAVAALREAVVSADWLIVTAPLTAATRGLVSRDVLMQCAGAVLLNSGRGAVIDEAAIPDALDAGTLRGAALDVFEVEPLPEDSPLWAHPRVIISPHISGLTTTQGAVAGFLECLHVLEQNVFPTWVVDRRKQY